MIEKNRSTSIDDLFMISFALTFECDKFCKHCSANSTPPNSGGFLPFDALEKIIIHLLDRGLKKDTIFGYTGGEPFLYLDGHRSFADVIRKTRDLGFPRIDIQTSGWMKGENTLQYEKTFREIVKLSKNINLSINLSYNKYQNEGVDQRVLYSIRLLWEYGFNPSIVMAVDLDNYLKTYFDFYLLAVLGLKARPEIEMKTIIDSAEKGIFNFSLNRFIAGDHFLILKPSVVVKSGRARSLGSRFFRPINNCRYVLGNEHCLHFDPEGNAYVCEKPHVYDFMIPLGNILYEPIELLLREVKDFRKAFSNRFSNTSEDEYICESCSRFCEEYEKTRILRHGLG